MRNLFNVTPPRFPPGPVDGAQLTRAFSLFQGRVLAPQDIRYPDNDFNQGLLATEDGVTVGDLAIPTGRTVGLPTLTGRIGNTGRAVNQMFLNPINVGNRNSVQSISNVLTATADATHATIAIAAHSVQYDFGAVPYNSGSITGLTPNTEYLVYADDPNFLGGAVSYIATQNPTDLIATGRYYVGGVTTAISATSENISSANTANPVQLTTATAHGWATNDQVTLAGLPGTYSGLDGIQTITVNGANTFTVPVDGTSLTGSFPAGTATRISPTQSGGGGAAGGGPTGRWNGFNFA